MSYLGRKGSPAPLVSSDIPDNSITGAKIVTDTIAAGDIGNDAVGTAELANDVVISTSGSITTTGGMTVDGATVFNEASADVDFRVESNGNANMLVVDASADKVGIGTATPNEELHIEATNPALRLKGTATDGRVDIYLQGDTKQWNIKNDADNFYVRNDTDGVMAMAIDTSGKVGIGTTSPSASHLTVEGDGGTNWMMKLTNSGTTANDAHGLLISASNGTGNALQVNNQAGSNCFKVQGKGVVFIGPNQSNTPWADTSGAGTIRLSATASGENNNIAMSSDTSNGYAMMYLNAIDGANNERIISFWRNDAQIGAILLDGTAGVSYEVSSDYRLKENVELLTGSVARLKNIKPSKYNFISEPDRECEGFIAHELQEFVPQAVSGVKDEMWPEELFTSEDELPEGKKIGDVKHEEKMRPQGVDLSKLTPVLVGALQEIITRVEALENA